MHSDKMYVVVCTQCRCAYEAVGFMLAETDLKSIGNRKRCGVLHSRSATAEMLACLLSM